MDESDLDKLSERIEAEREAVRQLGVVAQRAEAELDELAALEAAGQVTPEQAAKRLEAIRARQSGAVASAEQRERVVAALEAQLAEARAQLARQRFEEAVAKRDAAAKQAVSASDSFARSLRATMGHATLLARLRASVDEAEAAARELQPEGCELEPRADEAEWPARAELLAFADFLVSSTPIRPHADGEQARQRAAEEAERQERERVPRVADLIVRGELLPTAAFLALAPAERERALSLARSQRRRVEQEIRDRFARPDVANPWDADAAVARRLEQLERRIERLRDLMAEAEQEADSEREPATA